MRGGPIDLTPYGGVLTGIGALYWLLMLAGVGLALWLPKRWWIKLVCAMAVPAVFIVPVATGVKEDREKHDAAKARLDAAMAHFEMRCKGAGEKIYRVVQNVDGIALLKLRSKKVNLGDQFLLDDPYGHDCGGDECISGHLIDFRMVPVAGGVAPSNRPIYQYVEVQDAGTGEWTQYRKPSSTVELQGEIVSTPSARYGVTWEDISTQTDRQHWIAGGRLVIIDLRENTVIAERIGFLVDPGQGSRDGGRTPWTWARTNDKACPTVRGHNLTFVEKILKPTRDKR